MSYLWVYNGWTSNTKTNLRMQMTLSGNGHNEQLQVPSSSLWALMADHWNSTDEMSCPGCPLVQMSLLWGCASVCCVVSAEGALWMPPQLSHHLSARVLPEGTRDRMQSLSSQSNKKLFLPREAGRHIKESSVEGYFFFPALSHPWPSTGIFQGWVFWKSLRWSSLLLYCL